MQNWNFIENSLLNHVLTLLVIFIQIPLGLVNYFQFQKGKINQVQSEFEWEWLCVSKLSYKVIFKDFFNSAYVSGNLQRF